MLLSFILFTTCAQNNRNQCTILLKPLTVLYSQKQIVFNAPNFYRFLASFATVSFDNENFHLQTILQLLSLIHKDTCMKFLQGSLSEGEGSVQLTSFTNQFRSAAFYTENIIYLCYKTSCLGEELNCTAPSPSVSVPWCLQWDSRNNNRTGYLLTESESKELFQKKNFFFTQNYSHFCKTFCVWGGRRVSYASAS